MKMKSMIGLLGFSLCCMVGHALADDPYLSINGANGDYLTLNYYIDEVAGDSETVYVDFYPNEGNVTKAQVWSNLGRRDQVTLGDQDFTSDPGPAASSTNYWVAIPLNDEGGGKYSIALPVNKTGAYRLTARYKVSGNPDWKWYGGRNTAIVVSPKKSRDLILYEMMVNVINATGDDLATRSTFEDLINPAKNANIDYFKNLGVNTLWIQPIHPIGDHYCVTTTPGSPYSIQNMWEVAPYLSQGNTRAAAMTAFTNFAAAAKTQDIDFFFDVIFNHTSWDAEIGRDPNDPSQPAANPAALMKDIVPQWYSKYTSTSLPCGEYDYTQANFDFSNPAANSNQLGPAPAERIDFGKWPDVADLYWGRYNALFDPQTDSDSYWTTEPDVAGADVKRMTEYFAYFAQYWIEKSGGVLGGFRCDYAQGLPPQAWEYIVNYTRALKWDFVFMAESLDGGNVSKRAGRHMDIINQNWVWQVLGGGGNTTGLRGVIDQNKTDYGFAGIMRGLINHDQNAPEDKWYSFSRYAVGAVIDGTPQMYQGQELGYVNNWGFSQFRNQFDRWIPNILTWHNMQTLWNNRDAVLEDAYSRVNKGRMLNGATRLHDQWYLDKTDGSPHQQIFSVLKYDKFGWDPAFQNVVLNFVNLTPFTQQSGVFKLSDVQAIYLDPARYYNVRNLTSDDPNTQIWAPPGRTGQDIIDNGIYVDMPSDGINNPQYAFVQMLKLEEQGGPVDPYVEVNPENPQNCEQVAIRYLKANSPLGAGPVHIFIGRNGWQDIIDPAPQMANDGDAWVYFVDSLPGTTNLNFVFNDGSGNWDNNNGNDWSVTISGCTGVVPQAVWTDPETVDTCDPVTIYYNAEGRILDSVDPVYIHIGENGWTNMILPSPAMTLVSNQVWSYTYTPTTGTETINFVFNDGNAVETNKVWDNNNGNDWSLAVSGCGSIVPPPPFAITNPAMDIVVANNVDSRTLQGTALGVTGDIAWTNHLTGGAGSIAAAHPWTIPLISLDVGTNVITVSAGTAGGGTVTSAFDSADNYGGGWADGSNEGTGFGAWAFNHSSDGSTYYAGSFVGDPAAASISGLGASAFGFYANPPASAANAEVSRSFSSAMAAGDIFRFLLGLNWDSNNEGSNRGFSLMAGTTELVNINMANSAAITINGNPMFDNYGAAAMLLQFEYVASGSIRVWGTGRDGSETFDQTLTVPAGAPSGFKLYFNATDSASDERQMYVDDFAIISTGGSGSVTSDTVTIVRQGTGFIDSNTNGIPDDYEMEQFGGLVSGQGDHDGDFVNDKNEYDAGTSPTNVNDFLRVVETSMSTNTGRSLVKWEAIPQKSYRVWVSRNGIDGSYTNMGVRSTVGGSRYMMTIEDPESSSFNQSFYKVELILESGPVEPVTVSATPGDTTFTNPAGISVTLVIVGNNISTATYTLEGQAAQNFVNGQSITVGGGLNPGESQTLTVFAENTSGGSDTKVYTYTLSSGASITNLSGYYQYPSTVTTNDDVWVNIGASPVGAATSADVVYCPGSCAGDWDVAPMSYDFTTNGVDMWHVNLGKFAAGVSVQYAIVVRDGNGTEMWESNGGANYSFTVSGGGGGSTNTGGSLPPSTNPSFGQAGTKTVDGANNSEWGTNNLIAIDLANDDPRSLGDNWTMHETPADITHLWAAWDDNNLYLAWQFADITDWIDGANYGSGDALGNNQGILQFISIDTGAGGSSSNMWGKNDSFTSTLPDYQVAIRSDLWSGASYISKSVGGVFAGDESLGTNYLTFAMAGINAAQVVGNNAASSLWGVPDVDNYLNDPNTALTDYITHNKGRDTFYEMSIPLTALGLTRSSLEANGIGVFINVGSQSSLDTIPNDGATLDTPGVEVYNSSFEWSDYDVFTSPFARVVK